MVIALLSSAVMTSRRNDVLHMGRTQEQPEGDGGVSFRLLPRSYFWVMVSPPVPMIMSKLIARVAVFGTFSGALMSLKIGMLRR